MQLYNGDCLEVMDKLIAEGVKVDAIITDPPYRTTSRGNAGNSGGMLQKDINKKGRVFVHNNLNFADYMPKLYKLLKDETHMYIMVNQTNLLDCLNVAKETGFHFTKSLIWDKGNKIMGQYYMSQFEYILFFRKGKAKKINNCGTSDILSVPNKKTKDVNGKNIHDTEKPVELMRILIENSTLQNQYILDPFMGVGSTGIAVALLRDRHFIGIELDKDYYNIAKERIEQAQNKPEQLII